MVKKTNTKKPTKKITKSKTEQKVAKDKVKKDKGAIIEKEKSDAIGIVDSLSKSDTGFGNSWRSFQAKFEGTMESLKDFQKVLEEKKTETLTKRNETLEAMKHIVPKLKDRLGEQGSKNKLAYVIGANIDAGSISLVKRLLDRYEEMFGKIYPSALTDKEDSTLDTQTEGRKVVIKYEIFDKGKDEMVSFFSEVLDCVSDDTLDSVEIFLTNRDKIKGMRLVKK